MCVLARYLCVAALAALGPGLWAQSLPEVRCSGGLQPASTIVPQATEQHGLSFFLSSGSVISGKFEGIKITLSGTVTTADWTVAKLYEDVNHDSAISAGDTLLSTASTLSGGKFAFTGFSKSIASGTFQPNACMVSLTTSAGATLGHTFKLSIAAAADVTVTGGYPVQVYGAGGAGTA
ncbi:MAG: hypothetical protein IT463_00510, partial [Planctomycetes bacterium]|nr:hypothetical protein [Planctomycetota bacterium]